jgi:hypothetical protein
MSHKYYSRLHKIPSLQFIVQRVEALSRRAKIAVLEYLALQTYFTVNLPKFETWISGCRQQTAAIELENKNGWP